MLKLNYLGFSIMFILLFVTTPVVYCSTDKIVENFKYFSEALEESFSETSELSETRPGVHLLNSFGVGYTLANIHERLWNISVNGVPAALRTIEKYIPDDYGYLLRLFKKNKFKITSTIYSRYGNITKSSSSLTTLMSHLINIDYVSDPAKFVDSFSNLMETGTKGHLDNELLPKGLWQSVFDKNESQGAYINTMHFKGEHLFPWVNIGEKTFNSDTNVSFLEVEGNFPFFQDGNLTIVIVDIQQIPPKQLILAKSHLPMSVPQLKNEIRQKFLKSFNESFIPTKLRVQIPAISVTNLARHHQGLTRMGVDETFCNENSTTGETRIPEFVQQPIAQANHVEFAPGYIEISSATGSIVTFNTGELNANLDEEYDDDDIDSILVNDDDDLEFDTERSGLLFRAALKFDPNSRRTKTTSALLKRLKLQPPEPEKYFFSPLKYYFQKGARNVKHVTKREQCTDPDEVLKVKGSDSEKQDGSSTNILTFDTPFAFILHDELLGETFSGFISSLCTYNTLINSLKTSSIHAWLHDVFKVAFWKCY